MQGLSGEGSGRLTYLVKRCSRFMAGTDQRFSVVRLSKDTVPMFSEALSKDPFGWCWCVAWEVPTWSGWGERTSEQNRSLRYRLWKENRFEAYLLLDGTDCIGWCRIGSTRTWPKLEMQYSLQEETDSVVFSCFGIKPSYRRNGLLKGVLLPYAISQEAQNGAKKIFAIPKKLSKRNEAASENEAWLGAPELFRQLGFRTVREYERNQLMVLDLA